MKVMLPEHPQEQPGKVGRTKKHSKKDRKESGDVVLSQHMTLSHESNSIHFLHYLIDYSRIGELSDHLHAELPRAVMRRS